MKTCRRCNIEKPDTEFGIDKRYGSLNSYCRQCNREYLKEYYKIIIKPVLYPDKPKLYIKEGYRLCLKCNEEKPISEFYKHGGNTCKICANARSIANHAKNKVRRAKVAKRYRKRNKSAIQKKAAEYRAKINHSKYSGEKAQEYKRNISLSYIKSRIRATGIKNKNITDKLIEEWGIKILLERLKEKIVEHGFKICDGCKNKFELSTFPVRKHIWKGEIKYSHSNLCKTCTAKQAKKYKK